MKIQTDNLVIHCVDYRIIEKLQTFCNNKFKKYDLLTIPGCSLKLKDDMYNYCKENIDILIKLHNIKNIIIIEHENCLAYFNYYKNITDHNEIIEKQNKSINILLNKLKTDFPTLNYSNYYIKVDGTIIS